MVVLIVSMQLALPTEGQLTNLQRARLDGLQAAIDPAEVEAALRKSNVGASQNAILALADKAKKNERVRVRVGTMSMACTEAAKSIMKKSQDYRPVHSSGRLRPGRRTARVTGLSSEAHARSRRDTR